MINIAIYLDHIGFHPYICTVLVLKWILKCKNLLGYIPENQESNCLFI
jgi:hypothetical protein